MTDAAILPVSGCDTYRYALTPDLFPACSPHRRAERWTLRTSRYGADLRLLHANGIGGRILGIETDHDQAEVFA